MPSISLEECQARARSLAIEPLELESFLGCSEAFGDFVLGVESWRHLIQVNCGYIML